jgi:hypothetical protein
MLSPFPFVRALVAACTTPLPAQLVDRFRGGRLTFEMHGHAARRSTLGRLRGEPLYALPVRPFIYYPPALILLLRILAGWNKVRD